MSHAHRLSGMSVVVAVLILWTAAASAALGAAAPSLRYGAQAGSEFGYWIRIIADWKDYTETYEGQVLYSVVSGGDEQFELRFAGELQARSVARQGIVPPAFPIQPMPTRGLGPPTITVGRRGNLIDAYPLTPLPYVLGDLEMLVFEESPEQSQDSWAAEHEIVIKESQHLLLMNRPYAPGAERDGTERMEYSVSSASTDAVRLTKKHTLRTDAGDIGGATRVDMAGSGQFTFDTRRGLIDSMTMKYQYTTQRLAQPETAVLTIEYRLLNANELATLSKAEAARREASLEASRQAYEDAQYPQFRGLRGEQRVLAKLRSSDLEAIQETLGELATTPATSRSPELAKTIAPFLQHADVMVRRYAAQALIHWGTHDVEQEIAKGTESTEHWVAEYSRRALEAVRRLPAPGTPVYRTWSDSTGRFQIEAQLVSLLYRTVTLQKKDGQQVQIELSQLSEADQAFIQSQSAASAAAAGEAAPGTTAAAATPPPLPTRPAQTTDLTPVNLLTRIDPQRDQLRGAWKLEDGHLVSPLDQSATLVLPGPVPEQYKLTIVAQRMTGRDSLNIGLIVGGRQTMLVLEGWGVGASGLNTINGRTADNNETTFRSRVFTPGKPATIECTVRRSGVQVSCNGQRVVNWSGNAGQFALDRRFWTSIPSDKLFLGTWQTTFRISQLELAPLGD